MKKTWVFRCIGLLLFTISMVLCSGNSSEVHAATSYTNAKEYYNSVDLRYGGLETHGGDLYYGTKAKKATSSSNLRYRTIGFEITVYSGSDSVTFYISRTGSYVDNSIPEVDSTEGGTAYQYSLWRIPWQNIKSLATTVNSSAANRIFQSSEFRIRVSHIMTTFQGSKVHGSVTDNGNGTVTPSGTVYYLSNSSHLASMRAIFTRHDFAGMYNAELPMYNPSLTVYYNANGGTVSHPYTIGTFAGASNMVYSSGSILKESKTLYQTINLYNDTTLGLTRTGYHLDSGKEWTFSGRVFNQNHDYNTVDINSNVAFKNDNAVMTANWQPNAYYIKYDANGGKGSLSNSTLTYDSNGTIRTNTFTKTGYKLREGAEWNTQADGSGTTYTSNQVVKNLTSTNGATITLYAQWEPCEYKISTYKDGGTGGNDYFYELYNTRYFNSEETKDTAISSIELPTKTGYILNGYFTGINGLGTQIVDSDGNILVSNTYYLYNSYVYASWTPKEYTVTFDKQGGTMGTDSATVRYNETYPSADAPVKMEYTFKGYYSHPDGRGEMYYTENMAPLKRHTVDYDITLYAKWVDEAIPRTSIEVATVNWTRDPDGIDVIGRAVDKGSGLDYAELYCGNTKVAEARDLNGANSVELTAVHKEEGIFRYRIVAYDLAGNKSESYENVKYDVTSPEAEGDTPGKDEVQYEYTLANEQATVANLSNFTIELFVTDYKYDWGTGSEIGAYYKDGTFIPWSTLIKKGIVKSTEIPANAFAGDYGEGLVKIVMSNRVTRVCESAFEYCADLETIQFSKSLTQIDDYAFRSCTSLKNVVIPDTITQLGMGAFEGCTGLESVSIPDTLETINEYTFYGCTGLKEIVIPSGVKTVSDYAFDGCSGVRTITVPDTVTSIGTNAFPTPMFGDIEGYWFDEVINQGYAANEIPTGVSAVYKAVKPDGLFDANGVMLASWDELVNTYGFDITSGTSFSNIMSSYPELSSGVRLIIGEGVTSIGQNAFGMCDSLTSVIIPEGVTSICEEAFIDCFNLQSVTLPSTLLSIGDFAFYYCESLQSITIPEGVTSIGMSAFYGCNNLQSITLPSTLSSIGADAIPTPSSDYIEGADGLWYDKSTGNGYKVSNIPVGVAATYTPFKSETAGIYYKNDNFLSWKYLVSQGIVTETEVSKTAFSEYSATPDNPIVKVVIPEGVTTIGQEAFYGCKSLEYVEIPSSVRTICTKAFSGCISMKDVVIPEGVSTVEDYAFSDCVLLEKLTIPSTISSLGVNVFPTPDSNYIEGADGNWYIEGTCRGYISTEIPIGVASTYTAIAPDGLFDANDIQIVSWNELVNDYGLNVTMDYSIDTANANYIENVSSSAYNVFTKNSELSSGTKLIIGNSITNLGDASFTGCRWFSEIVLSKNITDLGVYTFLNTGITRIEIPSGVTALEGGNFMNCEYLSEVILPDTLTSIGVMAFQSCYNLRTISIPNSVSWIGTWAFSSTGLTSVVVPEKVTTLYEYVFSGCGDLSNVTLPEGLTTIKDAAFINCTSLASITLPESLTTMGNAFMNCSALTTITIPKNVTSIGKSCFTGCTSLTTVKYYFWGSLSGACWGAPNATGQWYM